MFPNFPLFPDRASALADRVDALFFFTLGVAVFFSLLIAGLIFYLGVKYRRRSPDEVGQPTRAGSRATTALEITWSLVPLLILVVFFTWGARVFFAASRPPSDAIEFYVVGKQWMWKVQHPEGRREINELHIPIGRAIKLRMTSQDVIHSFYMPNFRVKADVLPGRYTTVWIQADRLGSSHLFCAEYCGAEHSRMIGQVTVMEPHDYEAWLAGEGPVPTVAASGEHLFEAQACRSCHQVDTAARAPILAGLLGRTILLEGGGRVTADETYIRESIVDPHARIVAGYQPIMPTYKGQLSEEEILSLIVYIKTLKASGEVVVAHEGGPRSGPVPEDSGSVVPSVARSGS